MVNLSLFETEDSTRWLTLTRPFFFLGHIMCKESIQGLSVRCESKILYYTLNY